MIERVYDSVEVDDAALERARAALRNAERRVGVAHRDQVVPLTPPAPGPLTRLLPGGVLPSGGVVAVQGSTSLLCWLLGATQHEGWIAIVGWPELGVLAMSEAGVDLSRVLLVPDALGAAEIVGHFIGSVEIVVAGPQAELTAGERRRLAARARADGLTTILSALPWEGATAALTADRVTWRGPERGHYRISRAHLIVTRHTRADGAGRRFDIVQHDGESPAVTTRPVRASRLTG